MQSKNWDHQSSYYNNTSQAAPGALPNHLQRRTTFFNAAMPATLHCTLGQHVDIA